MKEIIEKNESVFRTKSRRSDIARARQEVYHDLFEMCKNPAEIAKFLKSEYNFYVTRSTIYYSWYKIKTINKELDSKKFIERCGSNMPLHEILDRYLLHHLAYHTDGSLKSRFDIIQKVNEITRKYEGLERN
jgi:hypothetical protein